MRLAQALPYVSSIAVDDVDGMTDVIADGLHVEFVQLEDRPFSAFWTVFQLPSMVLQFGREDVMVIRHVRAPEDRVVFLVPLKVNGNARWNGRLIDEGHVVVCRPGVAVTAADPAGTEVAILSVPADAAGLPAAGAPHGCAGNLWLEGDQVETLRRRLAEIWSSVVAAQGLQLARVGKQIAGHLSRLLKACVQGTGYKTDPAELSCRSIVARAEAFVSEHAGEPVSVSQLSRVAGVSERSLRNAFYDVYTTAPKRYFRIRQLHQAHRALREDWPGTSVTAVATSHGFYELGRFAGEYKALFGEAPSQTLHRARSRERDRAASAMASEFPIEARLAAHDRPACARK